MNAALDVILVMLHAILKKPAARVVYVDPLSLATAVGDKAASTLTGTSIDVESLTKELEGCVVRERLATTEQIQSLETLARLGVESAKVKLQAARKHLDRIQSGKWKPVRVVAVNVGDLRSALESAKNSATKVIAKVASPAA